MLSVIENMQRAKHLMAMAETEILSLRAENERLRHRLALAEASLNRELERAPGAPAMISLEQALSDIERGRVICDIGQLAKPTRRKLDQLAKKGEIAKWQGYWLPTPGASWGLGPAKTCFAREKPWYAS